MTLKLKPEYTDVIVSCPFTGLNTHLKFLDPAMYIHWYNKGLTHLFEVIEKKNKSTK